MLRSFIPRRFGRSPYMVSSAALVFVDGAADCRAPSSAANWTSRVIGTGGGGGDCPLSRFSSPAASLACQYRRGSIAVGGGEPVVSSAPNTNASAGGEWDYGVLDTYPPYTEDNLESLLRVLSEMKKRSVTANELKYFVHIWKKTTKYKLLLPSFDDEIRPIVRGDEAFIAKTFLDDNLTNKQAAADMPLAGRGAFVATLSAFVRGALIKPIPQKRATSIKPVHSAVQKTGLFRLQSTRGSGKTQLLKYCLFSAAKTAICEGRVMVVECSLKNDWFRESLDAFRQAIERRAANEADLHTFVISLIRAHMRKYLPTAVFPNDKVHTMADAYRVWVDAVGGKNVLIAFDTVDKLPRLTGIPRASDSDQRRGIVEAIAYLLPSTSSLIAVGTQRIDVSDITDPTDATVEELPSPRLPLFSYNDYILALNTSWGYLVPGSGGYQKPRVTTRVLQYLCGGSPRLLCVASEPMAVNHLLLVESWGVMLNRCVSSADKFMRNEMPSDGKEHFLLWAVSALASGTKTPVVLKKPLPLLEHKTWGDATKGLLYAEFNAKEEKTGEDAPVVLRLPPVLALGGAATALRSLRDMKVSSDLQAEDPFPASVPEGLRTWPKGLDVALLHLAASSTRQLSALAFADVGAVHRGEAYEKLVANAIVARWYLLWLMGGSSPAGRSIPLSEVLGSDDVLLKGISVDFSGGLVEDANQQRPLRPTDAGYYVTRDACVLQLCGAQSGHHDLRFAAIKSVPGQEKEHIVVSCQLKSGAAKSAKSAAELVKQCNVGKGDARTEVDLLLSIGPDEPSPKHNPKVLRSRCAHISSNKFCHHESVLLFDPFEFGKLMAE